MTQKEEKTPLIETMKLAELKLKDRLIENLHSLSCKTERRDMDWNSLKHRDCLKLIKITSKNC